MLGDLPAPRLRVYPRETVIAEKVEAIAVLGMANSRMKDYFDLLTLAREGKVDPVVLAKAIGATFERRGTSIPDAMLLGLEDQFGRDPVKLTQWGAFLRKNRLQAPALEEVVRELRSFLEPPLREASKREPA